LGLFNNAGYSLAGALESLTDEQILRTVDMFGAIRTTKAFIPHLEREDPDGIRGRRVDCTLRVRQRNWGQIVLLERL
jgi:hypothetical protein